MRRWQAIVLAAFVLVAGSYGGYTTTAHAGAIPPFTLSIDCDTSTPAVIDSACTYPFETSQITADVYITNTTGGALQIAAFNATVVVAQQFLVPVVPGGACIPPKTNGASCNPDFREEATSGIGPGIGFGTVGWSCNPVLPDQDPSDTVAASLASCINGSDQASLAGGATFRLLRVSYNSNNGISDLVLQDVNIFDETVSEVASCNPVVIVGGTCNNATVTVGAAVATFTATTVPTATPRPDATATPCSGPCPTATRLAFKTATPIVTPSAIPAATTAPAPATAPGDVVPPPGGTTGGTGPGGTTSGAGSRPIRLPDTGQGNQSGSGSWPVVMVAIIALGAAGIGFGAKAHRRSEVK